MTETIEQPQPLSPAVELEFAEHPRRPQRVSIGKTVKRTFAFIVGFDVLLLVLDQTIQQHQWGAANMQDLFNMALEDSLHNYVFSVQWMLVAGILWFLYLHARRTYAHHVKGWAFGAVWFFYMSLDDGAAIHERIGSDLQSAFSFFPSYAWQVLFAPLYGGMAVYLGFLVWRVIPRPWRYLYFIGIGLFILAVFGDYVDGRVGGDAWMARVTGMSVANATHYEMISEEFIEDVGVTFVLVMFLQHLMWRKGRLRVDFTD